MDLKKLFENKIVLILAAAGAVFLVLNIVGPKIVDALSTKVIQKLQRDYTPGPYAPGVDPEKVPPTLWRQGGNSVPDELRVNNSRLLSDSYSWIQQWEMNR